MKDLTETINKLIRGELNKVFQMGLKQSPFDADNSEFYAPLIELDIAPKVTKEIISLISEQQKQKAKWISVKDRLPYPGVRVLLLSTSEYIYIGDLYGKLWRADGQEMWVGKNPSVLTSKIEFDDITHWHELPKIASRHKEDE